jgi:glycosyltransferase involved in cell wall biosynthesis
MKKILITAYDVNPYKGSESGLGWNLIFQASKYNRVCAITRKNNRDEIERYIRQEKICTENLEFCYFDLPYYLRFWKVGSRGSTLYFYLWQLFITVFVIKEKISFDIAHNLNFSTDSIPSFLWVLGKPFVWGPINHHEKIRYDYIKPYGIKSFLKDRLSWCVKCFFWRLDPFNKISRFRAVKVLGGNASVKRRLRLDDDQFVLLPSSGADHFDFAPQKQKEKFKIIVAGRFVPLKGVDVAINSFIKFIENNPDTDDATLTVIGSGPQEAYLRGLAGELVDAGKVTFISWIKLDELIEHYKESSVFLFPSHEGAGMVVVEAMSYGVPVICFDNYGPGELVDRGSGIKVPYANYQQSIEDFSFAVKRLYDDKMLRQELAVGARKRFEECYTWDKKGLLLRDIYEKVAS